MSATHLRIDQRNSLIVPACNSALNFVIVLPAPVILSDLSSQLFSDCLYACQSLKPLLGLLVTDILSALSLSVTCLNVFKGACKENLNVY